MLLDEASFLALTKTGAGVFTLTGADTYTGATTVTGGVLAVDGSLASAATVANGATLRGTGTDSAGVTVQAGGMLAPGEGTGTFTAASLMQSGVFAEAIGARGAAGELVTTGLPGVVIGTGATLSLTYTGGAEAAGTVYTIAQANGGGAVTGAFSNAANGSTVVSGGHTFQVGYTTTAVTLTDVTGPPTIANSSAAQVSADGAAVRPFAGASVGDPNGGATDTLTVTPSTTGGAFTAGAASGATVAAGADGAETITGTAAQVTAALQALGYAPAKAGVPNGSVTTTFTLSDVSTVPNGAGGTATYTSAPDTHSRVTETDGSVAPAIVVAPGTQSTATANEAAVNPLRGVTVTDANSAAGQDAGGTAADTLTIVQSGPGVLTGAQATAAAGTYTLTGTAAQIDAQLANVSFTPVAGAPNSATTTTFSLSDASAVNATRATASVSVTDTDSATASAIVNTSAPQASTDGAAVRPFTGATVADPNVNAVDTLTIAPSTAAGTFALGGALPANTTAAAGANGAFTITGSAANVTAVLDALSYAPAKAGTPNAQVTTTLTLSDTNSASAAVVTNTASRVTETDSAAAPTVTGGTAGQATANDAAVPHVFAGVAVSDPNAGAPTETVTITVGGAGGVLSGGGVTGSGATYTLTGTAAQVNAALGQIAFTPTAGAPNSSATTTFSITAASSAFATASAPDTTPSVVDVRAAVAPVIGGVPASAADPAGGSVVLAPGLTVADPNAGAMLVSAHVTVGGFVAGDQLSVTVAPGVTATYDATAGVLTLSGAASASAYQQTLDTVAFSHAGDVDAGARQVAFTVADTTGAASAPAVETVAVAANVTSSAPSGGGGASSLPTNLDAQQGFATQLDNLIRATASDLGLSTPTSPLYAALQAEKAIGLQLDGGQLSLPDAETALYHLVDGATSVAEIAYAFFTGRTPSAAGLDYLVNSPANPNGLDDPYYARFTTENRYINFAVNLATGSGAGAAAFGAAYGGLSLSDAVTKAYAAVFGSAPAAGKVDAILNTPVSNGLGGTETRAQYFADITGGSAAAQKAAAIGFLLADSVKEGFGPYQQADLHFLQDLAHGTALFNTDLLAAYTQAPALVGQPVVEPTLGS